MAVRIDGSSDYVGRSSSLPGPVGFTMCGWADMVVDRNNFSSICALTASPRTNGQLCLQTMATGTQFNLWYDSGSIGVQELDTGYSAAVAVPFFWALVCEGTGANQVKAYFRTRGSNAFDVSFSGPTGLGATFTPVLLRFGNADTSEFWNGRLWNIKVWERALTSKELLGESFHASVLYPASLHLHYLLRGGTTPLDDTLDYSGNGRTATFNGTITTEPPSGNYGLWSPRRQLILPVTAAAGRTVNATTQALTLTGQAASVGRSRGVASTTQSLTLTGQPATVRRSRAAQGTTAALTLTGQPATVVRGGARTVLAATAALTLTGQPATVVRGAVARPRVGGGGFTTFQVPVYSERLERVEAIIEDIEQVAAVVGARPAINTARIELQRIAEAAQKKAASAAAQAKLEAAIASRIDVVENQLLDILSRMLKRLTEKQKPRTGSRSTTFRRGS